MTIAEFAEVMTIVRYAYLNLNEAMDLRGYKTQMRKAIRSPIRKDKLMN